MTSTLPDLGRPLSGVVRELIMLDQVSAHVAGTVRAFGMPPASDGHS
jgi:hypothetical protein